MAKISRVGVWQRTDGGVSITYFDDKDLRAEETEDDMIARLKEKIQNAPHLQGATYSVISASEVPRDRSQRNEWSLIGGKIQVDQSKVALKQAEETKRQATLTKIGITEDEMKYLRLKQ